MNIKKLYNKSFTTNPDMKLAYNTAINDCIALVNQDKIHMLKRMCHKMKCYQTMSGDCRQCQIAIKLNKLKGNKFVLIRKSK